MTYLFPAPTLVRPELVQHRGARSTSPVQLIVNPESKESTGCREGHGGSALTTPLNREREGPHEPGPRLAHSPSDRGSGRPTAGVRGLQCLPPVRASAPAHAGPPP